MPPSALTAHLATPLLGVSTGLRSFTPVAAISWFAFTGKLPVNGTWASWISHPAAVGLFTAAALGEYIGDKLPSTPNRTAPLPFLGRLAMGAFAGAVTASAFRRPATNGVLMGAVGALVGTVAGFYLRRSLTKSAGLSDLPVAITGDATSIALAVRSLRRLTA